ncbi:MAG: hypothetical protein L6Q99_15045 [Planctomycetes bacterium]|nr:hypothetical protein [Planctomycetota bacterium]
MLNCSPRALALAALIVLSPTLHAQIFGAEPIDPFDVRAASGGYVLHVDPDSPRGDGAATYRLSRGAQVLWTKSFDCTLLHIVLGDDGAFAGSATRKRGEPHETELVLMLVGPDGAPRFETRLPQDEPSFMHGPDFPYADDCIALPEFDRVIFRLHRNGAGGGFDSQFEEWRSVRWSSGEALGALVPARNLHEPRGVSRFTAARPIRGLPLVAVQALILNFEPREMGALFAVVDFDGRPVWEQREPHDYERPDDKDGEDRLWSSVTRDGALLASDEPARFAIALVREAKRVRFEVTSDPTRSTGWRVTEVDRTDHALAIAAGPSDAPPEYPPLALELVGTIALQGAGSNAERIHGFDVDDRGRLGAIVHADGKEPHFVLRGANGESIADVALHLGPIEKLSAPQSVWLKGERWLVHARTWGDDDRAYAWWLDLPTGSLSEIEGFDCAPIEKADGSFDGGFVALTSKSAPYTIVTTLSSFDAQGKLRWQCVEAYGQSEDGLFSPEAIAVSPRGEIGVLDNIKHLIQRFDVAGKLAGEIELEKVLGREPNYPSELGVDPQGNWIVYDFDGAPPVLRVTHDGKLTASFTPMYAEGREFRPPDGLRAAPDGTLWATDGYALVRLNEQGVVDRVLGDAPSDASLGEVEHAFVDHTGRILLADERTHAIHVFDAQGKPTALCKLDPDDVDEDTEIGCIAVAPDNSIHVGPLADEDHPYRGFAASGAPLGNDFFGGTNHFQPASGRRWEVYWDEVHLHAPDGSELEKHLRTPDDRWLTSSDDSAVTADGTLVVAARGRFHVFGPDGKPRVSLDAPWGAGFARLALSRSHVFASSGEEVWRTDLSSGAISKAKFGPELTDGAVTVPAWREEARELWIVDCTAKKVLRYRVKQ